MIDCEAAAPLSTKDYLAEFTKRAARQRVPLTGGINLTERCNLHCVHCCIHSPARIARGFAEELTTPEILRILDEIAAAGCLYFLITGGEPLLRPDFCELYRRATDLGMIVTVFSNGTHVTDAHVRAFEERPPRRVEITLYGATPETYDRITRVPGAFQRCLAGVAKLRAAGVTVDFKTIVMRPNLDEIPAIQRLATDLGGRFRLDAQITGTCSGEREPLDVRVTPAEAVRTEALLPKIADGWRRVLRLGLEAGDSRRLYRCGAGLSSFHITSEGRLQPCMMATRPAHELRRMSFQEAWKALAAVRSLDAAPDSPCNTCRLLNLCGRCPPVLETEAGAPDRPADFYCMIGRLRYDLYIDGSGERDP